MRSFHSVLASLARLAAVAALFAFAVPTAGIGCKKKEAPPVPVQQETPVAVETPVPAPAGLLVEGVIRAPDAILESLHKVSLFVPDKAGPTLAKILAVPAEVGAEIDGQKPCYLAVLEPPQGQRAFVFAVTLKDPAHVADLLGKAPGFKKSDDKETAMTVFESQVTPKTQVLGLRRNFLIASASVEALKSFAPYLTRTMPTKPLPAEDLVLTLPQAALRTKVRDTLKQLFDAAAAARKTMAEKTAAGGPPTSALDALSDYTARQNARLVDWLSDAGDARLVATTTNGSISLRAELGMPSAESAFGKQIASWPLGGAGDLLGVPASSFLAFGARTSDASRAEASHDLIEMLAQSFPTDVGAPEKTKLEGFLSAWDKSRGPKTSGGVVYQGPLAVGVALSLEAKDAPVLAKLMKDAFDAVLSIKGVTGGLKKQGIDAPKSSSEKIAGLAATVYTIALPHKAGEKPAPGEPERAEIVFAPSGSEVLVSAGVGAKDLLQQLVDAKTDASKSLGGDASLGTQVKDLGETLNGALAVFPTRILPMTTGTVVPKVSPPTDPILLSIGKSPVGPYAAITFSKASLETIVRVVVSKMMAGP